jgi:hypothetical protein
LRHVLDEPIHNVHMKRLIDECHNEENIDKQIKMLNVLNLTLPTSRQLKIPSLITNDYIHKALSDIEEIEKVEEIAGSLSL